MSITARKPNPAEIRRLTERDVKRDVHIGDNGRAVFLIPDHKPDPDDVEALGLTDLAEAAEAAEACAMRAIAEARAARSRASQLAKDGSDATTAQKDEAELEATSAERTARPLRTASERATVALVVEYRLASSGARPMFARRAADAHADAVEAHRALTAALKTRETAWHKAGRPGRERHYSADVGPATLGNAGTASRTHDLFRRMVEAFPADAVEKIAEKEGGR